MRRRTFSVIELAVVLFLVSLVAGITVLSFRGGSATGAARISQATLDSSLDAAINASLGNSGLDAVTPGRLGNELPEVVFVDGITDLRTSGTSGAVSLAVNSATDVVAVATLSAENYCFYALLNLNAALDEAPRRYGIVKDGATTPCTGQYAAGLLGGTDQTGTTWDAPVVFG